MMQVEVEILCGERKGEKFALFPEGNAQYSYANMPFMLETEVVVFRYRIDKVLTSVRLLLQDSSLDLYVRNENERDGMIVYETFPGKKSDGHYETLFYNYFGTVAPSLEVCEGEQCEIITLSPFEVMAKKFSGDQAEKMIDFIITETKGNLGHIPGATKLETSLNEDGDQPQILIEQLQEDIDFLERISPSIIHQPLSMLASKLDLRDSSSVSDIEEQGISWLINNLSVLQETDDHSQAHLVNNGVHYRATEFQVAVMHEHTDIYENRILHGYIAHLLKLTRELITEYENNTVKRKINTCQGYVSFFSSMKKALHYLNHQSITQIRKCQEKLLSLRSVYNRHVPVSRINNRHPRVTSKVRGNIHYLSLFQTMIKWYNTRRIDWNSLNLWLAIDNIPKLFEYYAVLRVAKWCKVNINNFSPAQKNTWYGSKGKHNVFLYYEPTYWMTGHNKASAIVNTELRDVEASAKDGLHKKRYHEYQHRSPDLVIEIKPDQNDTFGTMIIFDAKYSCRKQAFETFLPECTMKYVHGITNSEKKMVIKAMIILYPEKHQRLLDYHAAPFNIYGNKYQLPALGAQPLFLPAIDEPETGLEKLLARLFELAGVNHEQRVGRQSH